VAGQGGFGAQEAHPLFTRCILEKGYTGGVRCPSQSPPSLRRNHAAESVGTVA
jgi:hypothetical protein